MKSTEEYSDLELLFDRINIKQFPWEWQNKYYSGIGSRTTPKEILTEMERISFILGSMNFILRSGGADGADLAFERGAYNALDLSSNFRNIEIYLPWNGFNKRYDKFDGRGNDSRLNEASEKAIEIAQKYHPAWSKLSQGAKKLIARNTHQVLGPYCDSLSSFIICWTPDGAIKETSCETGGTGQAIRIATDYNIPVYNLAREDHFELWRQLK